MEKLLLVFELKGVVCAASRQRVQTILHRQISGDKIQQRPLTQEFFSRVFIEDRRKYAVGVLSSGSKSENTPLIESIFHRYKLNLEFVYHEQKQKDLELVWRNNPLFNDTNTLLVDYRTPKQDANWLQVDEYVKEDPQDALFPTLVDYLRFYSFLTEQSKVGNVVDYLKRVNFQYFLEVKTMEWMRGGRHHRFQ